MEPNNQAMVAPQPGVREWREVSTIDLDDLGIEELELRLELTACSCAPGCGCGFGGFGGGSGGGGGAGGSW